MKNKTRECDIDELKKHLSYNSKSGIFKRKNKLRIEKYGPKVGGINLKGYIQIHILGKVFYAHRLAWAMYYGEFPSNQIDHINGIKTDNRIANLRSVSSRVNMLNRKMHKDGKLPGTIIRKLAIARKWTAAIQINGKYVFLGNYVTEREAGDAYMNAMLKHYPEDYKVIIDRIANREEFK
jgi:hypothetical protein